MSTSPPSGGSTEALDAATATHPQSRNDPMFSSPSEAFNAAQEAIARDDWTAFVACCDADSVRMVRRRIVAQVSAPRHPDPTAESYMSGPNAMPRAVAEHHVAQVARWREQEGQIEHTLPGVQSIGMLPAMTDAAVFAAWLDGKSHRRQIERMARRGEIAPAVAEAAATATPADIPYVAIGAVPDGERLAQLVYRWRLHPVDDSPGGPEIREANRAFEAAVPVEERPLAHDLMERDHAQTVLCRQQADGSWRLVASEYMLNIGNGVITLSEASDD